MVDLGSLAPKSAGLWMYAKIGAFLGLFYFAFGGLQVIGPLYLELVIDALFENRFVGWGVVGARLAAVSSHMSNLVGWFLVGGVSLTAGTAAITYGNKSFGVPEEARYRPLTESERRLATGGIERLNALIVTYPDRLRALAIPASIVGFFLMIGAVVLFSTPFIFMVTDGNGLGAEFFVADRVGTNETVLYFDGVGGAELALNVLVVALGWAAIAQIAGRRSAFFAKLHWIMDEGTREVRRAKILAQMGRLIRRGTWRRPEDADAVALVSSMYRRSVPGALTAAAFSAAALLVIWPLDRAHYGMLTETHATVGPYFPPGQVRERPLSDVERVIASCYEGDDSIVRKLDLVFEDDARLGALGNSYQFGEAEQALLLRVADGLRAEGVPVRGKVVVDECNDWIDEQPEEEHDFYRALFEIG